MLNVRFFQTTPRMVIGPGCVAQLADEIRRLGAGKAFVVTDPGLVATGIVARVEESLLSAGLVVDRFDSVESDPRYEIATKAAESAQSFGAEVIIGIGGGSPLDIAKAASVLVTNEGSVNSFFGIDLLKQPGLPTILVPTTAGTGSEVTPIAILSDEAEKLKKGIVSPFLFPRTAFLDPELTLGLPPGVTAATGMDALIHAVEAYTSKNASNLTDMAAVEAMSLIGHNIRKAFADGSNIEARANMLEGSMLAGMAFANAGVTAVHAFAYPIGAEFHIPHGIANSIMLIPVMEFNMLANFSKFADMAEILGGDTEGLTDREGAFEAIEVLRDLSEDLQIPTALSGYGITESDIPGLAAGVMKVTRLLANNPRQLTLSDAEAIYLKAL
ncbi:MAG: alcohol dehydrogenase [Thermodesulfobacteriota bacterium]|nr:alcohol dehydrogenase [Thermodesulfobacteriota bacterium]